MYSKRYKIQPPQSGGVSNPTANEKERGKLVRLIREHSRPLFPEKTELSPEWERLVFHGGSAGTPVSAVIFDVYGTLFVSGAGDIQAGTPESEDPVMGGMAGYFRSAAEAVHDRAREKGLLFPEVDTEKIWESYRGAIPEWPLDGLSEPERCREIALRYELAVNPVYSMPDALNALNALRERGIVLGIISNAQFYSPLLFEAFFGKSPEELGFDPGLLVWSFEEGEAKPSPRLFQKAAGRLAGLGIEKSRSLFIGNDMKNDVIPAAREGFLTALFAGDRRSLRLRGAVPEKNKPSLVLRDLYSAGSIR